MSTRDPSSPFDGEWGIPSFYAIGGNTLRGLARRKPSRLLVLGDVFHSAYAEEAIDRVFAVMALQSQHTFFVLTKWPKRMLEWSLRFMQLSRHLADTDERSFGGHRWESGVEFPGVPLPNVWLGVSVEDQATADERIPLLLKTPAAHRFVSYEPAIGPVDFAKFLHLKSGIGVSYRVLVDDAARNAGPRIDWLIAGGESGPGARPFDVAWALSVVKQCKAARVPCFVKQLGARPVWDGSGLIDHTPYTDINSMLPLDFRDRKGSDPFEWPAELRVREVPT